MYVGGENEGQRSKTGRAAAVKDSSLTPRAEEERLLRKERRVEEMQAGAVCGGNKETMTEMERCDCFVI
jgi:hypothetical protein